MRLLCTGCGEYCAEDDIRALFNGLEYDKQPLWILKRISESLCAKPCPICGGLLHLEDGKYAKTKKGTPVKQTRRGWANVMKMLKKAKKDKGAMNEWQKLKKSKPSK